MSSEILQFYIGPLDPIEKELYEYACSRVEKLAPIKVNSRAAERLSGRYSTIRYDTT